MTAITAVRDKGTGAVRLAVTGGQNVTAIIRADDNGTRPVRLPAGVVPFTGDRGTTDHEAALSGYVNYRVQEGGKAVADAWLDPPADLLLPRLNLPHMPSFLAVVEAVTTYEAALESTSTFHKVPGRDTPLVITGTLSARAGSLDILCLDYKAALGVVNVLRRGQATLYRQAEHPGMDMYFHPSGARIRTADDGWTVTAEFTETGFPAGSRRADRTYNMVRAGSASFDAVATEYHSWQEVATGDKK